MSNTFWFYELQPSRLLCPWASPSKHTGLGGHFLLQGIFLTQRSSFMSSALVGKFFTNSTTNKGLYSQNYGFSSSHHKEGWVPRYWCFWIVVLEKTLESPLDSKEIKQVNPKGNQPWIFTGRTDGETEAPIFWPPDMKSFHWRKPWCWERLKAKEEGSRGWDGSIASLTQWIWIWQTLGDTGGQGSLMRCSPWGRKEPGTT